MYLRLSGVCNQKTQYKELLGHINLGASEVTLGGTKRNSLDERGVTRPRRQGLWVITPSASPGTVPVESGHLTLSEDWGERRGNSFHTNTAIPIEMGVQEVPRELCEHSPISKAGILVVTW
uniref:Uncharacterized protein n=1 Tax=Sphaerodactylus townsendi TaxID=933632 RepID=A0ACB8E4V5_9SAUR